MKAEDLERSALDFATQCDGGDIAVFPDNQD